MLTTTAALPAFVPPGLDDHFGGDPAVLACLRNTNLAPFGITTSGVRNSNFSSLASFCRLLVLRYGLLAYLFTLQSSRLSCPYRALCLLNFSSEFALGRLSRCGVISPGPLASH